MILFKNIFMKNNTFKIVGKKKELVTIFKCYIYV